MPTGITQPNFNPLLTAIQNDQRQESVDRELNQRDRNLDLQTRRVNAEEFRIRRAESTRALEERGLRADVEFRETQTAQAQREYLMDSVRLSMGGIARSLQNVLGDEEPDDNALGDLFSRVGAGRQAFEGTVFEAGFAEMANSLGDGNFDEFSNLVQENSAAIFQLTEEDSLEEEIGRVRLEQERAKLREIERNEEIEIQEHQESEAAAMDQSARILTLIDGMLNNDSGLRGSTGKDRSLPEVFGDEKKIFKADLAELENLLTLDNLSLMTGVLSESDIQILRNAASGIDVAAGAERMKDKLNEIRNRISNSSNLVSVLGMGYVPVGTIVKNSSGREAQVLPGGDLRVL